MRGRANGAAGYPVLTRTEVITIRSVYRKGHRPGLQAIGDCFGISAPAVLKIIRRQTYRRFP